MIISKTPFRISFAGGGSDHFNSKSKISGRVISTTINKFIYEVFNTGSFNKSIVVLCVKKIII